jgi:hypothetical protein
VKDTSGISNPLCAQSSLNATNHFGGQIDVNLCADTGARDAVFGTHSIGLAFGTAEEVSCDGYQGTKGPSRGEIGTSTSSGVISETKKGQSSTCRSLGWLFVVAVLWMSMMNAY